jgi:anthranilate phosphoribosyltransferase
VIKDILKKVTGNQNLTREEARTTFNEIMDGALSPSQIGGLLTALKVKGETIEEILGAAESMREHAITIKTNKTHLIDTCGTGGDSASTFNVSTLAAIVAAGAGVALAKHGNRSVSSHCGSADLLEALGVKIDLPPAKVEKCINEIGIGFLYAPNFHPAMKYAAPTRKELGFRTIFNLLGPLTNPAQAQSQLIGVYDVSLSKIFAQVLKELGTKHAIIVHSDDNLDEFSVSSATNVVELKAGAIKEYVLTPEQFGFTRAHFSSLVSKNLEENRQIALAVLQNKATSNQRDIILFNSGAAIYVGGLASSIEDGIKIARTTLESGKAYAKLQELINFTNKE